MKSISLALPTAGVLCCLAACGSQSKGPSGSVHISSSAHQRGVSPAPGSNRLTDGTDDSTPLCAQFSFQPFSIDSTGAMSNAGAPIVFSSTEADALNGSDAGITDQIAGCIAGTPDGDDNNWAYLVTATGFNDCNGNPVSVSPSSDTQMLLLKCVAGQDIPASVSFTVSQAVPNAGGYVDINASVNAVDVQIGCKEADIGGDGLLHFGESFFTEDGSIAQGLVGLDTGSPNQFGSVVTANGQTDTTYAGSIDQSTVGTIFQTFIAPCAQGGQEYTDYNHAQCVSDNSGNTDGGTQAELGDVFAEVDGVGYASVSNTAAGLQIYSQMSATGPVIMNANNSPFVPGYNGLDIQTIVPPAGTTITGIYIDQSAPLQFLVSALDAGGQPEFATLSWNGTAWVLGSFGAPTATAIDCQGLYASATSCFTPKACQEAPLKCTEQDQQTNLNNLNKNLTALDQQCQKLDSVSYSFSAPVNYCSLDNELELALFREYQDYVKDYMGCNGTCVGLLPPSSCNFAGGTGCVFDSPAEDTLNNFVDQACNGSASIDFGDNFCKNSQQYDSDLTSAYEAYVTAWLGCHGNVCDGMADPSDCAYQSVNGTNTMVCPTACDTSSN